MSEARASTLVPLETAGEAAPSPGGGSCAELADLLGDRFTVSSFERGFYRRDLAPVPSLLARLVGRTMPDAIARPATVDQVAAVLRYATAHRLPVTPRAAASTVYWNAVPVRGGIVLDLNGLRGVVNVDAESLTVSVLPATRWEELGRSLRRQGLDLLAYPTSAPTATVGGWLSMQGHGVGSLKHGPLSGQVRGLQAVLPDGQVVECGPDTAPSVSWFAGAEGTLGVVTRIDVAVRRRPESQRALLLELPDMAAVQTAVAALSASRPLPFYLHFADAGFGQLLRDAGFQHAGPAGPTLAVAYDGAADEVEAGVQVAEGVCAGAGGRLLSQAAADAEWAHRFAALRLKRAGPTLLAAECWLPTGRLADYARGVARLAQHQRLTLATYGMAVNAGEVTVMTAYPSNESLVARYVLDLSLTSSLHEMARRLGGRPYGTGVWNLAHSAGTPAEYAWRKRELDSLNIMNPGKLLGAPLALRQPLLGWTMKALALVRRVGGGG